MDDMQYDAIEHVCKDGNTQGMYSNNVSIAKAICMASILTTYMTCIGLVQAEGGCMSRMKLSIVNII